MPDAGFFLLTSATSFHTNKFREVFVVISQRCLFVWRLSCQQRQQQQQQQHKCCFTCHPTASFFALVIVASSTTTTSRAAIGTLLQRRCFHSLAEQFTHTHIELYILGNLFSCITVGTRGSGKFTGCVRGATWSCSGFQSVKHAKVFLV